MRATLARQTALGLALGLALVADPASADKNLGPQGSPIKTSHYTIDLYEGPVLAGARVVGLAGAYVPIAEGVAGYSFNPAAVAKRLPWSVDWFDWELDAGLTLPSSIRGFDYDNSGDDRYTNSAAFFATVGGGLQFGDIGAGLAVDLQQYQVQARDEAAATKADQTLNVGVYRTLLVVGYSFFKGRLVLGAGVGAYNIRVTRPVAGGGTAEERDVGTVTGAAGHLGALWQPITLPIRVGASVRVSAPASADPNTKPEGPDVVKDAEGNFTSAGYYLPRTISPPSEINAGVAVQLFRPMNYAWQNPHDEQDSEAKRVTRAISEERAARSAERTRRLAQAAEQDKDRIDAELDREDERLEALESQRVKAAKKADRTRRRQTYLMMPRGKLLVSAAVKMTTITTNGVGLESFLRQTVARSGEQLSFSPRLGVEGEAIPGYLVLRGGSYYEPSRFRPPGGPRIHGTFGLDVRIPIVWSVFGLLEDDNTFRVGGALDASLRYFGWGVSAGIWR